MLELLFSFFHTFVYQPLLNALFFLYQTLPGNDFGVAIIVLTVIIRTLLYPLNQSAINNQKKIADLQPKLQELQKMLSGKREQLAEGTLKLYRDARVNFLMIFFPFLVQLPILIALFRILGIDLGNNTASLLYPFIPQPENINFQLFGRIDGQHSYAFFALLAGFLQFVQAKMMTPANAGSQKSPFERILHQQTIYFFPVLTFLILMRLPSALALYWIITTLFSIGQQYAVTKKLPWK